MLRSLFAATSLALASLVLAGCPFSGECEDEEPVRVTVVGDGDRDGWQGGYEDCDDTRIDVHPGIYDPPGDGLDQDCDGRDGPSVEQPAICSAERAGQFAAQQGDTRLGVPTSAWSCNGEGDSAIAYRLFTSTVAPEVELRFRVVSDTPHAIVLLETCNGLELACGTDDELLTARIPNPGSVVVQIVALGEPGPFLFIADQDPILCGDHFVAPGEDCDDGNLDDRDGCSSTCRFER